MDLILGCIADDFTGGTDLANNLVRAGMRTVQIIGAADAISPAPDADAVVVALKSRTAPVAEAVAQSAAAARWLRAKGAAQINFKVCSTFDSTPQGNIGPVTEALMDELGADFVVITPAFPENARTVFKGHLFVGDLLLSDSSMRHHPLTPMTDASLVRVMQAQLDAARGRRVGLIDYRCVAQGAAAITARIAALSAEGVTLAVVDAKRDRTQAPVASTGPRDRDSVAQNISDNSTKQQNLLCSDDHPPAGRRGGSTRSTGAEVRGRVGPRDRPR